MWYISWFGDLVFGNESLLAYDGAHSRTMRPVKVGLNTTRKHIVSRSRSRRHVATAAKDG